jgi:hypothetical protein
MKLNREGLLAANRYFRLGRGRLDDLLALCGRLETDIAFYEKAVEYHGLFFHTGTDESAAARRLREACAPLGGDAGAFAALVVMSGLGHMQAAYRERGIPENVLVDSLRDMSIWMDDHEQRTGRTGLGEVNWLLNTVRGKLFRIGRFQFFNSLYESEVCVAVRRADGVALAFVPRGVSGGDIAGMPLHPGGYALETAIRLPAEEWELAVWPGMNMLDIHIPKDGRMDFDACRDSIREALRFFETYFPEKPVGVIHLHTWFLDPQLQKLLPDDSNIVRFQREFYLLPAAGSDHACLERVFGSADVDIRTAPEDTSLRRAVKRFMLAGGRMGEAAGVILPRDMHRFGGAQYQTRAAEALQAVVQSEGAP